MFKVYGIPNCDTIKKTKTWLDKHGVKYEFHDYRKQGITEVEIENWFKSASWEKVLNKASTTFKDLPSEIKDSVHNEKEAVDVLIKHPTAIKRPIIVNDSGIVVAVGFSEKVFTEVFG